MDWRLIVVGVVAVLAIVVLFALRFRKSETSKVVGLGLSVGLEENQAPKPPPVWKRVPEDPDRAIHSFTDERI